MNDTSSRNYIRQGWLVVVLALLYGGGLAGVQLALGGRIAANKRAETGGVIPSLVPGAVQTKTRALTLTGADGREAVVHRAADAAGNLVGWVVPASGQGFADKIELLIGLNAAADTITGLYVLDQKETPGLGDYITGADFRDRFKGRPADPARALVVVKGDPTDDRQVRALTGATISSQSVADIVNAAIQNLRTAILETTTDK